MRTSTKRSIQQVINDERLARHAKIVKFARGDLEIVEVKLEPTNKNKRSLNGDYFNVGRAILLWSSILTAVVFAVVIMGSK